MTRKHSHKDTKKPRIDDFKLINGIGPGVEKRLHAYGIATYDQLAALTAADIAAAVADLAGMSADRITKQDWIGQARALSEKRESSEEPDQIKLDEDTKPVYTLPAPPEQPQVPESIHAMTSQEEPPGDTKQSVPSGEVDAPPMAPASESPTGSKVMTRLAGQLHVQKMEILGVATRDNIRTLERGTPFDVQLVLDFSELQGLQGSELNYVASIFAKSNRSGQVIGHKQGTIVPSHTTTITVSGNILPEEGIYQLVAEVVVGLPGTKLRIRPETAALKDGGQIQVL